MHTWKRKKPIKEQYVGYSVYLTCSRSMTGVCCKNVNYWFVWLIVNFQCLINLHFRMEKGLIISLLCMHGWIVALDQGGHVSGHFSSTVFNLQVLVQPNWCKSASAHPCGIVNYCDLCSSHRVDHSRWPCTTLAHYGNTHTMNKRWDLGRRGGHGSLYCLGSPCSLLQQHLSTNYNHHNTLLTTSPSHASHILETPVKYRMAKTYYSSASCMRRTFH